MASKYPDTTVYQVPVGQAPTDAEDRRIRQSICCDFVASGSGSYYSRLCHNAATWVRVYNHSDGTVTVTSDRRCHRHRAIDERTAANRGWGSNDYQPFDAVVEAKRLVREAQAKAQEKRLAEISAKVAECALYITAHSELDPDTRASLDAIHAMATLGTLVVR